jgi:cell division septal protein FtsQ
MSQFNWEEILRKAFLLLIFCGLAFLFMSLRNFIFESDQFFYLQQVEIHGEKYLTHRDVMALSELEIGEKLFDFDAETIEQKISRSAYVEYVKVERRLPSTLLVFLEEEEPLAYITGNSLQIVSKNGRILPRAVDFDFPDLPIINTSEKTDIPLGDYIHNQDVLDALHFLHISQLVSVDLYAIISEISLVSSRQVRMVNGGAKLRYTYENLEEQLLNFSYFLDKKENLSFLSNIESVDIRFKDRVIVKNRKKS